MAKTEDEIKSEIKSFIDDCGGPYSTWYVGISENPEDRLFNGHKVDKNNDKWIIEEASSSDAARRIEKYFVYTLGTAGGPGGGDEDAIYVYAYKMSEGSGG